MKIFWACLVWGLLWDDPFEWLVRDRVEWIEVNHYHDALGKPVLSQLIFQEWNPRTGRLEICDYKLLRSPLHAPMRIGTGAQAFCVWQDDSSWRLVRGGQVSETWTQHDPENWQRRELPADHRRGLQRR